MVRRGEILGDGMEDEFYLRRLDAGLFVLQLICYIMVEISNSGIAQRQKRRKRQRQRQRRDVERQRQRRDVERQRQRRA
ncbi:hypothetical protein CRUP_035283 [Coryphaenoides rupestris]|nr:hypothetical protein CRUP_035283 [Coryphaenoides rupestris]